MTLNSLIRTKSVTLTLDRLIKVSISDEASPQLVLDNSLEQGETVQYSAGEVSLPVFSVELGGGLGQLGVQSS